MKKTRALVAWLLVALLVIVGVSYVRVSLRRASVPPAPSRSPSLDDAPVRLYGRVEPLGREVFVGPQQPRRVTRIMVEEGQDVAAGQALCELEQDVERQTIEVAMSRLKESEQRLEQILDRLKRKQELVGGAGAYAEVEVSQNALETEIGRQQIATAKAELELKRRELGLLTLRSPVEGRLYKFDVRLGEHLTPQDYQRIVIGKPEKQARLFVEGFWIDKVRVGDRFQVRDGETLREVGAGEVIAVSGYVGAREFRTDDALERLDTKYAQAILRLDGAASIQLGALVLCEREGGGD